MRQKYALSGALTSILLLITSTSTKAQVVVNNSPFATTGGYDISEFANADDFNVAAPITFNYIRFWAVDTSIAGANLNILDNFSGTLSWVIYTDIGAGFPTNTVVATGAVSSGITTTLTSSLALGTYPIFDITVPIGITTISTPGNYWLRLQEGNLSDAFDGSEIYWTESVTNLGSGSPGSINGRNPIGAYDAGTNPGGWGFNANDSAFQLVNAPEPGTLGLLFSATTLILYKRRRRA
jgi:hypothetical protein